MLCVSFTPLTTVQCRIFEQFYCVNSLLRLHQFQPPYKIEHKLFKILQTVHSEWILPNQYIIQELKWKFLENLQFLFFCIVFFLWWWLKNVHIFCQIGLLSYGGMKNKVDESVD